MTDHKNELDVNISVLVDARTEYTKQLIDLLKKPLLEGIISIYGEAKTLCFENNKPELTLKTFQNMLSQIPKWTQEILEDECTRIIEETNCTWMDDLLTAIFVSHTKILTTVRTTNKNKRINLKIPRVDVFMHKTYIELAKEFWKNPCLMDDMRVSSLEYQKNLRESEVIISECIESTIRKLLPVQDILRKYLTEDDDNSSVSDVESVSSSEDELEVLTNGGGVSSKNAEEGLSIETISDGEKQIDKEIEKADEPVSSVDISDVLLTDKEPLSAVNIDDLFTIEKGGELTTTTMTEATTPTDLTNTNPEDNLPLTSIVNNNSQPSNSVLDLTSMFTENKTNDNITSLDLDSLGLSNTPEISSSDLYSSVGGGNGESNLLDLGSLSLQTVDVDFGMGSSNNDSSSSNFELPKGLQPVHVQNDVLKEIENFHKQNSPSTVTNTNQKYTPTNTSVPSNNFTFF